MPDRHLRGKWGIMTAAQALLPHPSTRLSPGPMSYKPHRPRRDPFFLLIIAVALGMAVTLFYQVQVYYGGAASPLAGQGPDDRSVGG